MALPSSEAPGVTRMSEHAWTTSTIMAAAAAVAAKEAQARDHHFILEEYIIG